MLLGTDDLFREIAKHLSKVTDADYFDEIRLTCLTGKPVVTFYNKRDKRPPDGADPTREGDWWIVRPK
jgi:hypothetical protein